MIYKPLGNTGLQVSEIGLGAEHLEGKPHETVDAVIGAALDCGINIIDIFMPGAEVRSNLGRALGARRKDVILQGHIGAVLRGGQYARSRDPAECDVYVRDFLERFHTDYIDLGMLHFVDTAEDYAAVFESPFLDYVLSLKKQGVIRFIGASSHDPQTAIRMVRSGVLDMLMFAINPAFDLSPGQNVLERFFQDGQLDELSLDPARAELYNLCAASGVGITVMKALGAGRLLKQETSALGTALSVPQCISYALDRPAVASVLIGAQRAQEVYEACAYEDTSPQERDYSILSRGENPWLGGKCMYCNHCLPCPGQIDIAAVTKYLDMARVSSAATVQAHYAALSAHGKDCIGCGSCEQNCPFHIPVRENMRAAAELFGF